MVLRVDAGDEASAEQVERQVKALYKDLRAFGRYNVARKEKPAPEGSMASAGYEIGALVVSGVLSAAGLKALGNVLVAYVQRSKARSVEWEFEGNKGSFRALSAKDQNRLVDVVAARIAAGAGGGEGDGTGTGGEPGGGDGGAPDRTAGRD
ncbi:hypothetical protein FQU76_12900 [Streptomyces qinzhouensis]|uniref:Uncharacterized protein n=1 Tax=Streptomyces qinzhouensis TaxID=2599401 RepID=A0A5B8IR26_9ACTN|nr:hypothetical protein FQU76_12900 [Streptomyces qinzhouensis]